MTASRRAAVVAALVLVAAAWGAPPAEAWDGYDADTGAEVSIEGGNLVRRGESIEVYDWSAGGYRELEVEGVAGLEYGVEVEVYDPETGDYSVLEMEE